MQVLSVKVSTKHQIVVPSDARRALGIEAGDRLTVQVTADVDRSAAPVLGGQASVCAGWAARCGSGVDPVDYVRELRHEWDDRVPR